MLTVAERETLAQNVANSTRGAADFIRKRVVGCWTYMYSVHAAVHVCYSRLLGYIWVAGFSFCTALPP